MHTHNSEQAEVRTEDDAAVIKRLELEMAEIRRRQDESDRRQRVLAAQTASIKIAVEAMRRDSASTNTS